MNAESHPPANLPEPAPAPGAEPPAPTPPWPPVTEPAAGAAAGGRTTGSVSSAPGGGWFGTVMLVVALVALLLSGMLWQRLDRIQQELAKRSASVAEESEQSLETAHEAKAQVQELQARLTLAEVKLSEVSLQRTQLEELMLSVSRSRDDTLVLDIESGIRLAMQQAELTGSAQPLVSALQAAMRRIDKSAQPRLNPVQRAMARDLDKIKASTVADLPMLASRLDELARSVDEWALVNDVGRTRTGLLPKGGKPKSVNEPAVTQPQLPGEADAGGSRTPAPTDAAGHTGTKKAAVPAKAVAAPDTEVLSVEVAAPWWTWHTVWARWGEPVWSAARDLVRVSRIDEPDAVLLTPQQTVFMRENLKLRLLNVRLSLLSRQITAARADMQFVKATLAKYFDAAHVGTRQAMQTLDDALLASRSLELPRPDDTLSALATAAGGR